MIQSGSRKEKGLVRTHDELAVPEVFHKLFLTVEAFNVLFISLIADPLGALREKQNLPMRSDAVTAGIKGLLGLIEADILGISSTGSDDDIKRPFKTLPVQRLRHQCGLFENRGWIANKKRCDLLVRGEDHVDSHPDAGDFPGLIHIQPYRICGDVAGIRLIPGHHAVTVGYHVRGAFTGANTKRIGRIELADNGTLFLDEIGDLSAAMQSKLLQVLEDSAFERVGESQPINVDIRIISATNINIQDAIRRGTLRADLFYRLGTVMLHLPPLRERRKDIPLFISHFIKRFSEEYKIRPPHLRDSILDILCAHTWPGNIRELRNAVTSLLLRSMEGDVTESFVRESLRNSASIAESAASVRRGLSTTAPVNSGDSKPVPLPNPRDFGSLRDMENRHILEALERCGGKVAGPGGAAALLGIPRSTLQYRLRKLGIKKSGSVR